MWCVCVCVCVCVHICVCMHWCVDVRMCVYIRMSNYISLCTYVHLLCVHTMHFMCKLLFCGFHDSFHSWNLVLEGMSLCFVMSRQHIPRYYL